MSINQIVETVVQVANLVLLGAIAAGLFFLIRWLRNQSRK